MKVLIALFLILSLIACALSEETDNSQLLNEEVSQEKIKTPWFFKQHEIEDLKVFFKETLLSVENVINPNSSSECIKSIATAGQQLIGLEKGQPRNFGIAIEVIENINKKCGFDRLLHKFINNLSYIVDNGLQAFIVRQIHEFESQSGTILNCFKQVFQLADSRELQSDQLGKCIGYLILDPIL